MPERQFLGIPNWFMLSDTEFRVFLLTIVSDDRLLSALLQCTLPVGGCGIWDCADLVSKAL